MQRPLLKAFLLRDISVLGKLVETEHAHDDYRARLEGFKAYLEFLRQYGLVRDELSVNEQIVTLSAIFTGFFLVEPLMPDDLSLPDDVIANRIGDAIERSLGSGRTPTATELQTASTQFAEFLSRSMAAATAEFQCELES